MPRGRRSEKKSCLTCKSRGRVFGNGSVDCLNEKTAQSLGATWDFGIDDPGDFYCSNYSPAKKGATRGTGNTETG